MHGQKPPTAADKRRFAILVDIGCICCQTRGIYRDAEIHHLTEGMRRLGHKYTIPLCAWCHRGVVDWGESTTSMRRIFGPSFAHSRQAFERRYGPQKEILKRVDRQVKKLRSSGVYEKSPGSV